MEISICGSRKTNFVGSDGNQIVGTTYYYLFQDRYVDGYAPDKIFIRDGSQNSYPFIVGERYEIAYNRYGKIDFNNVKHIEH